jgi:LPPG:FO 2-phospho-L-lactate transferase
VVICPSNPFVSVEPILAVPGIKEALNQSHAPIVAVTPIVRGSAVKGPAAKMMRELGMEVSGESVARHYGSLVDAFIVDESDTPPCSIPGVRMVVAPTMMRSAADSEALARRVLLIANEIRAA